jgi:alpha-1,3-rhamnosyl/mannosyltransferase
MNRTHTILIDARAATRAHLGINRYVRSLLTAMIPELAENELLHVILSPDAEPLDCLKHPRVTTHVTSAPFGTFKSHYQAFKIAIKVKADIYHAPYILTPVSVPGKMVLTIHDVIPLSHPHYSSYWMRILWKYIIGRRVVKHSRKIIGVSNTALKVCEEQFGERIMNRSTVIYHGISSNFTPQSEDVVSDIRIKYGLPERFFLYVGSDMPHKNLSTVLHAMALMDTTSSMPLALAGFDPEKSDLKHEVEDLHLEDRVLWVGEVPEDDLPALYTAAHALVFPSLAESFGFPVLESMACGTPVICSSLSVLKEITGGNAKIVSAREQREWRNAMDLANVSLEWHDAFREKALAWVSRFSWTTTARSTLNVYRSLYRKK